MKVKVIKPARVNALPCEVEVTESEAERLFLLGLAEPVLKRETPEKAVRTTRKK